jgi:hypothetical protein
MRVAHGMNVRAHAIKQEMHGQLGRNPAIARELAALEIRDHHILGGQHAFVHACGSSEDAIVIEPHGEIAFAGDVVPLLVHPSPGDAHIAAMLHFIFGIARGERVWRQVRTPF